jgi:glycerophosphoryl diester phosphodiesterase
VTYPTLVGHRGVGDPWAAQLGIPEESIPAIEWAAAHHADVLEGDVQSSGDGVQYMMHDATLDRTTSGTGSSTGRSWSYIKSKYLELPIDTNGNGDPDNTKWHPPSFSAWLAAAKATGKICFVELKNGPMWDSAEVRKFWSEVKRQGMTGRVIVAGSESDLATVKGAGATKRSMALDPTTPASSTKIKSVVGSGGYVTLRLTEAEAYPDYVRKLNADGFKVFLWTLTRDEHYARALPFGVYGWMTNNTDDAWTWLQNHGA